MKQIKHKHLYLICLLFGLMLIGCTPVNRTSHADFVWNTALKNKEAFDPIKYINTFPLSDHFDTICNWHIEFLKTDPYVPVCMLNARQCFILSEDSIYYAGNIYHYNEFDEVVYQSLQKGLYLKSIPSADHIIYSNIYFVFNPSQNKEHVKWWIYKTKQGISMYADSLYQTVKDSQDVSFYQLNQLYTSASNRIQFTPYLGIYPPKSYTVPPPPIPQL